MAAHGGPTGNRRLDNVLLEGGAAQLVGTLRSAGHPGLDRAELVVRLPSPGDSDYRPSMDLLWVRFSFPATESRFFVDDVVWEEVVAHDEWQSWQKQGMDLHSLVADPLFVDRDHDDFRLRPESPAWALGVQPIPWDRIGPYASPLRASWPIIESAGAREMLRDGRPGAHTSTAEATSQ